MATLTQAYQAGKALAATPLYMKMVKQHGTHSRACGSLRFGALLAIGEDSKEITPIVETFYAGLTADYTALKGPSYSPFVNL